MVTTQCNKFDPTWEILMDCSPAYIFSQDLMDENIQALEKRFKQAGVKHKITLVEDKTLSIQFSQSTGESTVRNLLNKTGLELRLLKKAETTRKIVDEIDNYLALGKDPVLSYYNIFSSYPEYTDLGIIAVDSLHINRVNELLNNKNIQKIISKNRHYLGKFIWGNKFEIANNDEYSIKYKILYYVQLNVEISALDVKKAQANMAHPEMRHTGKYVVDIELTKEGARKWRRITGNNIGSQTAIILEDEVYMTPSIKGRLPNGKIQVSSLETLEEAEEIANIMNTPLSIPMEIIQTIKLK